MSQTTTLNPHYQFPELIFESPFGTQTMNNIKYSVLQQKISIHLNKLIKSTFYHNLKVHFGVKCTEKQKMMLDQKKKNRKILEDRIIIAKKKYQSLVKKIQNKQILQNILSQFKQQIKNIQIAVKQIKKSTFLPWIYIQANKKQPIYGYFNQSFNRKGIGIFSAKLGCRSPFHKFDTLQFLFESPFMTSIRRKYFNMGLNWNFPTDNWGNFQVKLQSSNSSLFDSIDENSKGINLSINKQNKFYEIQHSYKTPIFFKKLLQYNKEQYYLPSHKLSFKYTNLLQNSINFGDITIGSYKQLKSQVTIPGFGNSQFFKMEYNWRKFFDTYYFGNKIFNMQKYFLLKKFFLNSSLQTNISWNIIKQFHHKNRLSTILDNIDIRGFQPCRVPNPSYVNLKSSVKLNLHNYPVLGKAKIIPFLYGQIGASWMKNRPSIYKLASMGLGLSYYVAQFTQLQVLYNLIQVQSNPIRQPINFQIRIGVFD